MMSIPPTASCPRSSTRSSKSPSAPPTNTSSTKRPASSSSTASLPLRRLLPRQLRLHSPDARRRWRPARCPRPRRASPSILRARRRPRFHWVDDHERPGKELDPQNRRQSHVNDPEFNSYHGKRASSFPYTASWPCSSGFSKTTNRWSTRRSSSMTSCLSSTTHYLPVIEQSIAIYQKWKAGEDVSKLVHTT